MTRSELSEYFTRVRETSEEICAPLAIEDQVIQPIDDVSPPKWHLGHTSWFYEAMFLDKYLSNYKPFHPDYAYVFNSYYESLGVRVDRPLRGTLSRPGVEDVSKYRFAITERMCDLIESVEESLWPEFSQLIVLALNHEQQHQELLLTDIKYILASNPLRPNYLAPIATNRHTALLKSDFISFKGGVYKIGHQGDEFCYDNETPAHQVYVNDFKLQNRLVANGEYLEFIEDGGYSNFEYWLSDAWALIREEKWSAPLYWEKIEGEWHEYTLRGLQKLDPNAPVCHVSYYEADAFAQWAKKRLPTEAEWEIAAQTIPTDTSKCNFYDSKNLHPVPFDTKQANGTLHQMLGDVWEWTGSAYLPYPGYKRIEGPLGEYNGKFMINQMVLRGGSCATSEDHIRITYRNFFQPEKRWQFKGFRLAEDAN